MTNTEMRVTYLPAHNDSRNPGKVTGTSVQVNGKIFGFADLERDGFVVFSLGSSLDLSPVWISQSRSGSDRRGNVTRQIEKLAAIWMQLEARKPPF